MAVKGSLRYDRTATKEIAKVEEEGVLVVNGAERVGDEQIYLEVSRQGERPHLSGLFTVY